MIPLDPQARFDILLPFTGGNAEATELLVLVGTMVRIADDLADDDANDRQEAMARVLTLCLVEIPQNPFYDDHRHHLQHLLGSMVAFWQVSNRFHRIADERMQTFGFVLREANEHFTLQVCALCVGWEKAASLYIDLWTLIHGERTETVTDWMKEA